jgi:hypothetical protein
MVVFPGDLPAAAAETTSHFTIGVVSAAAMFLKSAMASAAQEPLVLRRVGQHLQ